MALAMKPALWCPGIRQGHPLARGLVAAWPWVGSANLRDVVGDHHMTAYNTPTVVSDEFGRVVALNDAQSEYLQRDELPVSVPPFSMAIWFKSDADLWQGVMGFFNSGSTDRFHLITLRETAGDHVVYAGSWAGGGGYAISSVPWVQDEWHHAVGVWQSSASRAIYYDGGNKGTDSTSIVPANLDRTAIGGYLDLTPNRYMSGRLAMPLIWNRALDDFEAQWLYEEPWSLITPRTRTYFWVGASGGAPPGLSIPVAMNHYRRLRCA